MNVTFGINTAKSASRPYQGFEPEMYTEEALHAKAKALGVETMDVSAEGAKKLGREPLPVDRSVVEARIRDYVKHTPAPGNRELHIGVSPTSTVLEAMREIRASWDAHSMPDGTPLWVESDVAAMAELCSLEFKCMIGRPDDWKRDA